MPLKPICRSKLFWLGMLPLVFLLWAWYISGIRYTYGMLYPSIVNRITVVSANGSVNFEYESYLGGTTASGVGPVGFRSMVLSTPEYLPLDRAFEYERLETIEQIDTDFTISYWFICLLYLFLWITTTLLWRRRIKRLADKSTTPNDVFTQQS